MRSPRQALRSVSRRVLIEWAAVAAVSTVLVAVLAGFSLTARADNLIHDVAARLLPRAAGAEIVVVAIDDASLAQLGAWPWPRDRHAALLRRLAEARPRAVLYDVLFTEPAADPAQDAGLARAMRGARVYLPVLADRTLVPPIPTLAAKAAGVGAVDVHLDEDGLVRRAAFGTVAAEPLAWALYGDLAPAAVAPGSPPLIRFADPKASYATASFASVLAGEVPDAFIKDRIVLVGATAAGLGERFPTPLSGGAANMPGVELQANIIDNLLGGHMVRDVPRALVIAACILPLWLLLAAFLLAPPRWTLVVGAGLAALLLCVSMVLYGLGFWLPPAAGVAGLALVFPLWGWRRLAATSDGLALELTRLRARLAGSEEAPVASSQAGGDVLARQMEDISLAIEQVDDLRRFAADALFSLPDATLVLDPNRRVLAANGAARALFGEAVHGRSASALIGSLSPKRGPDLDVWPPQDAAPPVELVLTDGRAFEMQSVWRLDEAGAPAGWIVRLADVTLLKSALRQREQALQLLTHDMRSPQTSILALLQSAPEASVEASLGGRIAAYARRTLALADGFVRLARAEDATPRRQKVDLSDVLMEAADELWPQSRQRGMTIEQAGLDEPRFVRGDREILTRVFVNLLSNAVKYGPEHSIIRLTASSKDGVVEVEVADEGPGFTAEEQARLFGAFSAFERPQAQTDGVGLGLAFVQTAVTRHGGQVALCSAPGVGAVFAVSLPAA
ncbi:CHASE2 domain-containing protein [Caulobacter segnis]|uniref:CHASE2 domain-containing protein n=1 Tax=Caulobacter segnis TaxID=88688 RepID=UPI00240F2A17|nr:CHASE2 domain-containing protein [Caulobacter segnis]MDG2520764.1 CHASE2 domain-containing protein [Caulobacter segnis]